MQYDFSSLMSGAVDLNKSFKISGVQNYNNIDVGTYNNSRYGEMSFGGKNTPVLMNTKIKFKVGTQLVQVTVKANSSPQQVACAVEQNLRSRLGDKYEVSRSGKNVRVSGKK
ncbi:MAG: hypothetical protein A2289_11385 [Deltaproteobacteria bacterium RIFOXYA12_FULL_58_15]|nr:MAG: hypothetical protein A2289_11385 [Deltaproteobacteria bacterium RIFOXYA12_FULL_58_15]OGR07810.1 MAG: hypothetical protein A2341_07365 [Deltaproteobacteria bacterium RIFOXYB12_FULL_58_9]